MCIKLPQRQAGWTLTEMMVAVAIFSLGAAALSSTFLFSLRSMAALSNYTELDQMNQNAMDRVTREIRQSKMLVDYTTNALQIVNGQGNTVTYLFSPYHDRLYRLESTPEGGWSAEVLLEDCELLNFRIGQRNVQSNSWNYFPPTHGNFQHTAKVVDLSWRTSRRLPHGAVNSEDIQTAKIVIRKK